MKGFAYRPPTRIPVRWRFRDVDFATFKAWFRLKLADGADWFAITLPGAIGKAAETLGISRKNLWEKMRRYDIKR